MQLKTKSVPVSLLATPTQKKFSTSQWRLEIVWCAWTLQLDQAKNPRLVMTVVYVNVTSYIYAFKNGYKYFGWLGVGELTLRIISKVSCSCT